MNALNKLIVLDNLEVCIPDMLIDRARHIGYILMINARKAQPLFDSLLEIRDSHCRIKFDYENCRIKFDLTNKR